MPFSGYNDFHEGRQPASWEAGSAGSSTALRAALAESIAAVEAAIHQERLLSPTEAMALACGEAREKETLYSIASKISLAHDVPLDALLTPLSHRFHGYD